VANFRQYQSWGPRLPYDQHCRVANFRHACRC
jgi:hypothetical protein